MYGSACNDVFCNNFVTVRGHMIIFKSDDFKTEIQQLLTNYIHELMRANADEKI